MTFEEFKTQEKVLGDRVRGAEHALREFKRKYAKKNAPHKLNQIVVIPKESYSHVGKLCRISNVGIKPTFSGWVWYFSGNVLRKDKTESALRASWESPVYPKMWGSGQ